MRFEIPTLTRCCGCFPLRRGIIILGYLSLAFAVFFLWVEVQFEQGWREHTVAVYRGATFYAEEWLPVLLYCIEIVFILLLLVGAHMKNRGLLQVYYYYGVTTTGSALAIFVWALMSGNQPWEYKLDFFNYYYFLVELATIFIGVVTQAYLLLLIRSELQNLWNRCTSSTTLLKSTYNYPHSTTLIAIHKELHMSIIRRLPVTETSNRR